MAPEHNPPGEAPAGAADGVAPAKTDLPVAELTPAVTRLRNVLIVNQIVRFASLGFPGLSPGAVALLPFIRPQGSRAITLASQAGITRQAAGQIMRELRSRGYVTVTGDATDARAKVVRFTALGLALREASGLVMRDVDNAAREAVGADGLERLLRDATQLSMGLERVALTWLEQGVRSIRS